MLQGMQHKATGTRIRSRVMKICCPGNASRLFGIETPDEPRATAVHRDRATRPATAGPRHQVAMMVNTATATTIGNQPPSAIFNRLALRKVKSMTPKAAKTGTAMARAPAAAAHIEEGEPGRDRHHAADRDAISRSQVIG